MPLVAAWLRAFVCTIVLETPVVVWLTRDVDFSTARRIAIAVFANLATHPVVWFVIMPYDHPLFGLGDGARLAIAETWAFAVEAAVYFVVFHKLSASRAVAVSALANGFSFAAGLLLYQYTSIL
jgi:hypothetical protein